MGVFIGTSGWQYDDWRGAFYPKGLATSKWLGSYATRFSTVESNSAFYRLPERTTFERWAAQTPEGFVFAVKASRYLTHVRRLQEPQEPVKRFMDRVEGLGSKLGPVLLQLPPTLRMTLDDLDATLKAFPTSVRVAVEPRHPSWFGPDTRRLLERYGAAWCLADRAGRRSPDWTTADWGYVRFHEGRASPRPAYGRTALASWARRIADLWGADADVYCYFNNDTHACAPRDAHQLALAARRIGLTVM